MSNSKKSTSLGKIILGSAIGFIAVGVVLSILMVFVIGGIIAAASSNEEEIKENSVLVMKLNMPIVEQQQDNIKVNFMKFDNLSSLGLNKILEMIKKAKNDENIKGIFLDLSLVQGSLADLHEIKKALADFKSEGKFIVAHTDVYTHSSYYIATVADKIYLTPTGNFLWKGFASQIMYLKGTFEKLEIEPEIIRHGKFKSAVEPYIRETMSDENRLQIEKFLFSLWDQYVDEVAQARNLEVAALNLYADSLMISSSKRAMALGLIDQEKHRSDVIEEMKQLVGIDADKKLAVVSMADYIDMNTDKMESLSAEMQEFDKDPKIAVIYAEGEIIPGKSQQGKMGSKTISEAIKKAADNEAVKAIVLRVNSPGGSALASEVMLHQLELAKAKKPIVVSMGRYAASGGYYISCNANKIFAEPYTLTGSIGVFGMLFNGQKLLNNKLGINVNVVKTNANSDFGGVFRPLSTTERNYLQGQIEDIYDEFITHVADGRGMTKTEVDEIAQGRVWLAPDALKIGLVDEIGGIDEAIKTAAELGEVDDYEIVEYPKVKGFVEMFLDNYKTKVLTQELGTSYEIFQKIQDIQNLQGIQARMPYDIDVY